jgi:hypothetical protein
MISSLVLDAAGRSSAACAFVGMPKATQPLIETPTIKPVFTALFIILSLP